MWPQWRSLARCRLCPLDSESRILIYGRGEETLEVADLLKASLDVTVMIAQPAQIAPPRGTDYPVMKGITARRKVISASLS